MRQKQLCVRIPAYFHVRSKFMTSYLRLSRARSVINVIAFYQLPLKGRSWVQIPVSAKPRRKTGGEDNHGSKSSLVCELLGPIDGIFQIQSGPTLSVQTNKLIHWISYFLCRIYKQFGKMTTKIYHDDATCLDCVQQGFQVWHYQWQFCLLFCRSIVFTHDFLLPLLSDEYRMNSQK